ncbi:MAG: hypothetical protein AAB425_10345, partial [Bdellovibrionota bacterium]
RVLCLAIGLAFLTVGCSPEAGTSGAEAQPLSWAYDDLDQGREAKVILGLESAVQEADPTLTSTQEATFLSATAYVGAAGVNIYTFFDSFQDVLFSKSLSDQVFSPREGGGLDGALGTGFVAGTDAPLEKVLFELDNYLNLVRRAAVFLKRLPEVSEERLPLLRQGLYLLDEIDGDDPTEIKEIALYRLLTRLVYLRTHIMQLITNEEVGKQAWFCQQGLLKFKRKLEDFAEQVMRVADDAELSFPANAEDARALKGYAEEVYTRSLTLWESLPSGVALGSFYLERTAKQWLSCDGSQPLATTEPDEVPAP